MKRSSRHPFSAALLAALAALAFAACGGHHDGGNDASGDKNSSSSVSAAFDTTPAVDISGDWTTLLDDTSLGVSTFRLASSGALSGSLLSDFGETAAINGHLSGREAEYTMTFQHRPYLAAVDFASDGTTGSGTLVDADGHVHTLKLHR